jgi:2-polyprenyl-3-methyl-5-hydroxy-6-metoxy-1,4-benzoquinol methylase
MRLAHPNRKASPDGIREHTCRICGDAGGKNRYVAREMVHGTREPFDYLLCGTCGTLYLADPPGDIGKYYENYYSVSSQAEWKPASAPLSAGIQAACRASMNNPSPGSTLMLDRTLQLPAYMGFQSLYPLALRESAAILDVGCGNGFLVEALDRIGFRNVCGCDPFLPEDIAFPGGARLVKRMLADLPGGWDLIMLHHSFEHVPDPAATARLIDARLTPGGRCLLRFPNVDSVEFARYGGDWWGIHAPRHYHIYSRDSLDRIFAGTGLKIERVWCDSQFDHYTYSYDFSLGYSEVDPSSVRQIGRQEDRWPALEVEHIQRNIDWYNEKLIGDWIVYVLRKA